MELTAVEFWESAALEEAQLAAFLVFVAAAAEQKEVVGFESAAFFVG